MIMHKATQQNHILGSMNSFRAHIKLKSGHSSYLEKWQLSFFFFLICSDLRFSFFFLRFYLFEKERESMGERERERESEADSALNTQPDMCLHPTTVRS